MDSDFILLVIKGFTYWSFSFQIIISYRSESEDIDCFMESESEVSNMGETECFSRLASIAGLMNRGLC